MEKILIDRNRANAAFRKGLDDLDAHWEDLMQRAEHCDNKVREREDEDLARYLREDREYEKSVKAAEDRNKGFFSFFRKRAPIPVEPSRPLSMYFERSSRVRGLLEVKHRLSSLEKISRAAIDPLYFDKYEAIEMVDWESGDKIESLLSQMEDEK